MLSTKTLVHTVATMFSNNASIHIVAGKCDRQKDMDEPRKCSSLTLKREVHLTNGIQEEIYLAPAKN
jgi:predicted phosphodiesterase